MPGPDSYHDVMVKVKNGYTQDTMRLVHDRGVRKTLREARTGDGGHHPPRDGGRPGAA